MSIDTTDPTVCSPAEDRLIRRSARKVFGKAAKAGRVYRWGLAVANQGEIESTVDRLSRLAVKKSSTKLRTSNTDWQRAAESLTDWLHDAVELSPSDGAVIVTWAAALPRLAERFDQSTVDRLIDEFVQLHQAVQQRHQVSSPSHLMLVAELGLTLAWRYPGLRAVDRLAESSWRALVEWSDATDDSVSAALEQSTYVRVVLASLIRCQRLTRALMKRSFTKSQQQIGRQLALWAIAMTVRDGSAAFSKASETEVADDLGPHGLLAAATAFDRDALPDALDGALGVSPTGGRLTWQALLPKAFYHDTNAKVAVMFADWDVSRGRTHVDYSDEQVGVEVWAGRRPVIRGSWFAKIETDAGPARADGPWNELCEFSDDDIHYLEIEQPWTDDLLLQRQFMLIRDDRCLLIADSVVPAAGRTKTSSISYQSCLAIDPSMRGTEETETREIVLGDQRPRALLMPLAANEWRVGPSDAVVQISEHQEILTSTSGRRAVYMPLWFDFRRLRFQRKRTWRQLTVADQLRIVDRDEAAGYRVQVGSEQWVIYRSLLSQACRSFLGKHLIADFFCSRFDPEDGGHEALVTVDDEDES